MSQGTCDGCGKPSWLIPLHGGKGGPLRCPFCVGKWNAEHGRKRRIGRIVIRALKAFYDAGGTSGDVDKLKNRAALDVLGSTFEDVSEISDPLGYMDGIARIDGADADLTSELLADVLQLVHPDHQPPERKESAHRVTQALMALQPLVFPAPKPKPPLLEPKSERPEPKSVKRHAPSEKPRYPCADCADRTPYFYCDSCRAEYEKRKQQEFEKLTGKQRADYKRRREKTLARRPLRRCEACGTQFKRMRAEARYCCDTCRLKAHRKALVTDKNSSRHGTTTDHDSLERGILAILDRHPAVFLNDLLPEGRTRAQYQALCLAAARLEADGKIETFSYWARFGKPGFKLLTRLGAQPSGTRRIDPDKIPRLQTEEQICLK